MANLRTNPNRDATASIRGYVYQIYQSLFAWVNLSENETLILEGAEDFDVYKPDNSVTTTQVKDAKILLFSAHYLKIDLADSVKEALKSSTTGPK